jgi:hypothetical protein
VRLYKPGKNNLSKTLTLADNNYDVTVVEYWPHFEMQMIESQGGKPVIVYSATGMAGRRATLDEGDTVEIEGVNVHFLAEGRQDDVASPVRGELVIHLDDGHHRLAVPANPPAEINAGGYLFRIVEFAPNFRVGGKPSPSDPMTNPAIRVHIEGPDGNQDERLLFAFHPDFDMGHAGADAPFQELDLVYRYGQNLYLVRNDSGGLTAQADFDMDAEPEGDHNNAAHVDAGDRVDITPGTVTHSVNFAFLLHEFWESAVETPSLSDDANQPAAARIEIEDEAGNKAERIVQRFRDHIPVDVGGQEVTLYFGPLRIPLPYRLHLDDFLLVTYPGSQNPASFESHVRVFDEERGIDGEPVRIYMNHPLDYRGFKHFQSSYDQDRKGTILSVNHDPGKLPTYIGYTLVGMGLLITLTRGLVWYRIPQNKRGA